MNDRRAKNLTRMRNAFIQRTKRDIVHAKQAQLGVKQDDLERLAIASLEFGAENCVDRRGTVKKRTFGHTPGQAFSEFEGGRQLGCLGGSDSRWG